MQEDIQQKISEGHKRFQKIIPLILSQYQCYSEQCQQLTRGQTSIPGDTKITNIKLHRTIPFEYSGLQDLYQHLMRLFREYKILYRFKVQQQMNESQINQANNLVEQVSDAETSELLQVDKIKRKIYKFNKLLESQNKEEMRESSKLNNIEQKINQHICNKSFNKIYFTAYQSQVNQALKNQQLISNRNL